MKQINYNLNRPANGATDDVDDADDASPIRKQDHSDTDFAEDPADSEAEDEEADEENVNPQELEVHASARKGKGIADQEQTKQGKKDAKKLIPVKNVSPSPVKTSKKSKTSEKLKTKKPKPSEEPATSKKLKNKKHKASDESETSEKVKTKKVKTSEKPETSKKPISSSSVKVSTKVRNKINANPSQLVNSDASELPNLYRSRSSTTPEFTGQILKQQAEEGVGQAIRQVLERRSQLQRSAETAINTLPESTPQDQNLPTNDQATSARPVKKSTKTRKPESKNA